MDIIFIQIMGHFLILEVNKMVIFCRKMTPTFIMMAAMIIIPIASIRIIMSMVKIMIRLVLMAVSMEYTYHPSVNTTQICFTNMDSKQVESSTVILLLVSMTNTVQNKLQVIRQIQIQIM